ncbi:MAG: putative toxin-antitoxin system toxin component, PIN family [Armatimonadota bacterium]|nr:putative toxin-antitoxin system toxin component, PIN family [Armatimonadota bacterium]
MTEHPKKLIRVVLDTNVFVAAYWAPSSASAQLIQACRKGLARAQYSPEVRSEVERVLRMIKARQQFLQSLEAFWATAEQVRAVCVDTVRVSDPDDQKFLEAAVGAQSDFLVTNDQHLLSIGQIGRTEIVTPSRVMKIIAYNV